MGKSSINIAIILALKTFKASLSKAKPSLTTSPLS